MKHSITTLTVYGPGFIFTETSFLEMISMFWPVSVSFVYLDSADGEIAPSAARSGSRC